MILPATNGAVLLLCLLVFLALGCWILPWRLASRKLRFEIFALDFSLGAVFLAIIAAFTLGSMGSELTFADSLLVSGHRAQASVLAAGLILGLGNVALIASASLGGVAPSFSIAGALGTVLFAWMSGLGHPIHLTIGSILAVITIILLANTLGRRNPAAVPVPRSKAGTKARGVDTPMKSLFLALPSGFAFAGAAQLVRYGTSGELGVAPYAGFVFIALPALITTFASIFFLFNFPLQGSRLRASDYFSTHIVQHAVAIVSGMIWGAGILGCFLVRSASPEQNSAQELAVYSVFGSFVLAAGWGLSLVALPERLRAHKGPIVGAVTAFALAVYFLGYAVGS